MWVVKLYRTVQNNSVPFPFRPGFFPREYKYKQDAQAIADRVNAGKWGVWASVTKKDRWL